MDSALEVAIPVMALLASIGLAVALLTRQRSRVRPETVEPQQESLQKASRRQKRVLEKLEPLPQIPTLMDLVREEIEETGVEKIPGHEGLSGPVMLKVFKRDHLIRERCTHDAYAFVIQDGIEPAEATENQVTLFCDQCGEIDPTPEPGTVSDPTSL